MSMTASSLARIQRIDGAHFATEHHAQHHVHKTDKRTCATPSLYFWRQVKWSPDGSHLLAQSDDHHLDVFRYMPSSSNGEHLAFCFSVHSPSTLLAFAWYPFARYDDPTTWCFVLSAKDVPVRLVDAYHGQPRATYGLIDHTERFVDISALAFSLDGTRLYAGHGTSLTTFDVSRPGIDEQLNTMILTPTRRAARQGKAAAGQRGVISCLDVSADGMSGTYAEVVAIGTFAGTVGLYRTDTMTSYGEQACLSGWKEAESRGISQISFHPSSPSIIFVASRRHADIRAYDLRYVGSRRSFLQQPPDVALLATFPRQSSMPATQQRLYFHIDSAGRRLLAGDAQGMLRAWDISLPTGGSDARNDDEEASKTFFGRILRHGQSPVREPANGWHVANSSLASIACHPFEPLFVVASGARSWSDIEKEENEDDVSVDVTQSLPYTVPDGGLSLYNFPP